MVKITYFQKENGNTVYVDGKPATITKNVELPLRFRFGSYNEPKKVLNISFTICDVDDIISIEPIS
jgi:hypothetical protein